MAMDSHPSGAIEKLNHPAEDGGAMSIAHDDRIIRQIVCFQSSTASEAQLRRSAVFDRRKVAAVRGHYAPPPSVGISPYWRA